MSHGSEREATNVWWAISEAALVGMLRRVEAGEDPAVVLAEEYANGTHDHDEGGEG